MIENLMYWTKHSVSSGGDIGLFLIKVYAVISIGVLISIGVTINVL